MALLHFTRTDRDHQSNIVGTKVVKQNSTNENELHIARIDIVKEIEATAREKGRKCERFPVLNISENRSVVYLVVETAKGFSDFRLEIDYQL